MTPPEKSQQMNAKFAYFPMFTAHANNCVICTAVNMNEQRNNEVNDWESVTFSCLQPVPATVLPAQQPAQQNVTLATLDIVRALKKPARSAPPTVSSAQVQVQYKLFMKNNIKPKLITPVCLLLTLANLFS